MVGVVLFFLLLRADATDEAFLLERLRDLRTRYEDAAGTQSQEGVRVRAAVVREVAHLPFAGESRAEAGKLLARIVLTDRAYRIRADAARAIGRVGTPEALEAMYRALFGEDGRSRRFELLHAVLPEALAALVEADAIEWIGDAILKPAARREWRGVLKQAGPLRYRAVILTLEGLARGNARALGPEVSALAASRLPSIRGAAVRTLVSLDLEPGIIAAALRDDNAGVRGAAASYPRLPLAEARALLSDALVRVRRAAARGLARRPVEESVSPLIGLLGNEEDPVLRLEVIEMLNGLTGKDFGEDAQLWGGWWDANRATFKEAAAREEKGRTYFFDVGLRTRRVMFLIDVSGSMAREDAKRISRLEYAARELATSTGKLPPNARFCVLAFAGDIRRFPAQPPAVGARQHAPLAAAWLRRIKPTGATNTYGALMTALTDPLGPDTIVLLSDGNPFRCTYQGKNYSEHEQILAEVRRVNAERQVRIHTVALLNGGDLGDEEEDAAAAADFLRRLAEDHRGEFREIR